MIQIPVVNTNPEGLIVSKNLLIGKVEAIQGENESKQSANSEEYICPVFQVAAKSAPETDIKEPQDDHAIRVAANCPISRRTVIAGGSPDKEDESELLKQPGPLSTENQTPPVDTLKERTDSLEIENCQRSQSINDPESPGIDPKRTEYSAESANQPSLDPVVDLKGAKIQRSRNEFCVSSR